MIALFGMVKAPNHSLDDLIELYKRPTFIAYFSVIEVMVFILLIASKHGENVLSKMSRSERDPMFGWPWERLQTVIGITYGMVGGMISSQSIIFAKSGIELLLLSISGKNQFDKPLSWIIVTALVITALLQVCSTKFISKLKSNMFVILVIVLFVIILFCDIIF